jgi:AcrR family transcriptional regulator
MQLTLAHVAHEAGVAPATLVQRFGSKRDLLLALVQQVGEGETSLADLRAQHQSPRAALLAYAECMAGMAATPEELANHLGFLIMDLTDAEFHRLTLDQARAYQKELKAWCDEAVRAKEFKPCDTSRLARLFAEVLHGALLAWAIYRDGEARRWVRREMEAFLEPYRLEKPPRKSKRR